MIKAFNLLDEPWIPVRTHGGKVLDLGLLEVLTHAKEFASLDEASPPNLVALHRLLLAIVHRALTLGRGRWTDRDRVSWFRDGFPEKDLKNYLDAHRERFWLFHPECPFMQVAALAEAEETRNRELKPWTQVALERVSGNAPVVFDHSLDERPSMLSYGQALRNLLGFLQFSPSGLVQILRVADQMGPLGNTAAVLPIGSSLLETLSLAIHPSTNLTNDLPTWELPPPKIADLMSNPKPATGPNDRYTRLSRAALLDSDPQFGYVRRLRFAAGLRLKEDVNDPDPMASYRINKEGKPIRISYSEGRTIWRDLPSFVPDSSGKFFIPAAVLGWATNLYAAMGNWDRPMTILSAGLASEEATRLRWRSERIDLPQNLMSNSDAASMLRKQVRRAEDIYADLRSICFRMIANSMPEPDNKNTRTKARARQESGPGASIYFSSAERGLPNLMQNIVNGNIDKAYQEWSSVLELAAEKVWKSTCQTVGYSSTALRAEAISFPSYCNLLLKIKNSSSSYDLEKKS